MQNELIPTTPILNLPQITYQDMPVVTTDMLAQAYEVEPKRIRQNFSNNKERFVEGKHYFLIVGDDLREFKNRVELNDSVEIGKQTKALTLYTARGAARHAKSLETDKAWDVYELLEDTFFKVEQSNINDTPQTLTKSTATDREPLRGIAHVWAAQTKQKRNHCYKQINAFLNVDSFVDIPLELIPRAIAFVQERIDAHQLALDERQKTLSITDDKQSLSDLVPIDNAKPQPGTCPFAPVVYSDSERVEGQQIIHHLKKIIEDFEFICSLVNITGNMGGRKFNLTKEKEILFENGNASMDMVKASLFMAEQGLKNALRIKSTVDFV